MNNNKNTDFILMEIIDRLISSGLSESDAIYLLGSFLEKIVSPEEISNELTPLLAASIILRS